jgi:hypothetical protein
MQNFTVHLGSATPLSYRAGPRAPAPPRSRCHRGPPGRRQCAVVRTATRRRRASHPGRGRPGHGRGQAPRRRPAPRGTSTTRPPSLFLPSLPHRRSRRSSVTAPTRPPVSTPLTQTAASGHRQPTLPSWIPAEHRHRPPLPGELLSELPIPAISCNFLTPLPLRCCRTPHPVVATHLSPLPTDERRRPTPFAPPHRRPAVPVRPCPLLLVRHLLRDPLEISGNTLPPLSHRRARHRAVPRTVCAW